MRLLLLPWISLILLSGTVNAAGTKSGYVQSYAIYIKGAEVGIETATEKLAENGDLVSASEHELFITDGLETKRMAFSTRMVLSKGTLSPVSYSFKYTSGDAGDFYNVVVKDGQVTRTLSRDGHKSEVTVPFKPDMVILDFSVYHQYEYLIRKYDSKRGGRQLFSDFVPLIANDIPLTVTFQGNANLELDNRTIPVRNFQFEFVGIWSGSLTVDKDGRLVRLVIPAQDLEVVRKDLLPQ